jgi:hypothetical protein
LPVVSLRPPLAFNPRHRRLSTPSDAFQLHPDIASYGTTLKETKTKAFSKEGLARAASSKDPKEKAREDARDWLNRATDGLNEQMEAFEAEARSRYTRRFPRDRVRASRTPILKKDFLSRRSSLSAHTTVSTPTRRDAFRLKLRLTPRDSTPTTRRDASYGHLT